MQTVQSTVGAIYPKTSAAGKPYSMVLLKDGASFLADASPSFSKGDTIQFTGDESEYNGKKQYKNVKDINVVSAGGGAAPTASSSYGGKKSYGGGYKEDPAKQKSIVMQSSYKTAGEAMQLLPKCKTVDEAKAMLDDIAEHVYNRVQAGSFGAAPTTTSVDTSTAGIAEAAKAHAERLEAEMQGFTG